MINKKLKVVNEDDVDIIVTPSIWNPQNIRILNTEDCGEKGVCYTETKQTWISLLKHINEDDIYLTSVEESIHQAIRDNATGIGDESLYVNLEQEEWVVERMFWALSGWILLDE